jgi:hypothetical protein
VQISSTERKEIVELGVILKSNFDSVEFFKQSLSAKPLKQKLAAKTEPYFFSKPVFTTQNVHNLAWKDTALTDKNFRLKSCYS